MKRAYRLALQAGKLLHAPYVPMLRENNIRQGFFEREMFEAVRAELPEPLRPVVTFGYLTGWRIRSEVLPLQWHQTDRSAGIVRLEPGTTKNTDGRTFPYRDLLPELRDTIEAQWEVHENLKQQGILSPWVFPRHGSADPGGRIGSFRKVWKTACDKAGCPQSIPHDFRRSAVRNLVRAGVPERTAMMLTGHKTRSVFDRYDIVNEADLEDAVRKLGESTTGTERGQSGRYGIVRRIRRSDKS